jgi:hypothetical protein
MVRVFLGRSRLITPRKDSGAHIVVFSNHIISVSVGVTQRGRSLLAQVLDVQRLQAITCNNA